MASKVSKFEELKADRSYLEELKRKSEKERIRRQAGAKKLKEEHKLKRLQKEQELKDEQRRREEKLRRQAKVSVEVTVSLKKVIDHLTEVKKLVVLDQVFKELGCKGSKAKLLELLKKSTYVEVKDDVKPVLVKYKSKYNINTKNELEDFMFNLWKQAVGDDVVHGVNMEHVADSYLGCDEDIADLISQGKFYQVVNPKTQEKRLFYPDRTTRQKPLDSSLLNLWNEQKVDSDRLDELLREHGVTPARRVFKWKGIAKVGKVKKVPKKREYRPRNVTNVHMPELFQTKKNP